MLLSGQQSIEFTEWNLKNFSNPLESDRAGRWTMMMGSNKMANHIMGACLYSGYPHNDDNVHPVRDFLMKRWCIKANTFFMCGKLHRFDECMLGFEKKHKEGKGVTRWKHILEPFSFYEPVMVDFRKHLARIHTHTFFPKFRIIFHRDSVFWRTERGERKLKRCTTNYYVIEAEEDSHISCFLPAHSTTHAGLMMMTCRHGERI